MTDMPPPPPPPPPPTGGVPAAAAYPEKSQATLALVLSILGVCCGIFTAVPGLIIANNEKNGIAAGRRDPSTAGTAQAAYVVAIVFIVLSVVGIIINFTVGLGRFGANF